MKKIKHKKAFTLGGIVGLLLVLGLNYISYLRNLCPETIDDCGWSFGFPFHFYLEGGFVTYSEIIWLGLFLDVLCAIGIGIFAGVVAKFIWSKLTS